MYRHQIALLLFIACSACGQSDSLKAKKAFTEFTIYENGLIYDQPVMEKLRFLVDSLNLRFKRCEPKAYNSLYQGKATYIRIEKNLKKARAALAQRIPLQDFINKVKGAEILHDQWVVKEREAYDGKKTLTYHIEGKEWDYISVADSVVFDKNEGWVFEDEGYRICAFYLHGLTSTPLPPEYGSFIQYVDCMIDTTARIFPEVEMPDSIIYTLKEGSKVKAFYDLSRGSEEMPMEPTPDIDDPNRHEIFEEYRQRIEAWDDRRMVALDLAMKRPENIQLLKDAVDEAIENQTGGYIDAFVGRYLDDATTLALKRSYRVHGFCGADPGPRLHAKQICMLAATTFQWDIFLRAHMDILNDNFDRTSDGSYAWGMRGTYLKELEQLEISTIELLIGTCLRSKETNQNHYSSSTARIGRAMTDSKDQNAFEDLLLRLVQDERLDLYNRMEMAYVYIHYSRHLDEQVHYKMNIKKIRTALQSLPDDLASRYDPLLDESE